VFKTLKIKNDETNTSFKKSHYRNPVLTVIPLVYRVEMIRIEISMGAHLCAGSAASSSVSADSPEAGISLCGRSFSSSSA